jgi:23S rRNA (guanine745-N1)-methyltransferase
MLAASGSDTVLDVGCGEGFYLGNLCRQSGSRGFGIDIAVNAIEAAARRYPTFEWIVGNADRFVPYQDASFSIVMSITGRMNPDEFRRVLRANGRLLVAVASPEDLVELRGAGVDRVARTAETFARHFRLLQQQRITTSADLDAASVEDVRHSIYRPMTSQANEAMQVTFSLDLLLFAVA